jgi:hypothetical protein
MISSSLEGKPSFFQVLDSPVLWKELHFYVLEKNREVARSPGRQSQTNFVFEGLGSRKKLSGFGPHLACRCVLFGLVYYLLKNEFATTYESRDCAWKFGCLASLENQKLILTLGMISSGMASWQGLGSPLQWHSFSSSTSPHSPWVTHILHLASGGTWVGGP